MKFLERTMPGPPVVVCQGDEVLVDVYNRLRDDTTSIHFHGTQSIYFSWWNMIKLVLNDRLLFLDSILLGEHFRNGEQYMDGVPYITQCPILPGTK